MTSNANGKFISNAVKTALLTALLLIIVNVCALETDTAQADISQADISQVDITLNEAHNLRSSEPQKAKSMLDSVQRSSLTNLQQDKYDFLSAYLLFMHGKVDESILAFKDLAKSGHTTEQRFSAHSSLVSLYAGTQNWSAGFETLTYLSNQIDKISSVQAEEQAHMAAINFYSQLDEYELMIEYTMPLISNKYSPRFTCVATMQLLAAQVEVALNDVNPPIFANAIAQCEQANEKIVTLLVYNQWAIYLFKTNQIDDAIGLLREHLDDITKSGYEPLLDDFHMLLSQTYFEKQAFDNARDYALKIIGEDVPSNLFSRSDIVAFEILYKISEQEQDFEQALHYHKRLAEAKSLNLNSTNAKMLSIQKAKQDSEKKSSQIALLDAENSLLKTKAELNAEAAHNKQLLLATMSIALLFLCFWLYKNRSNFIKLRDISRKDNMTGIANRHYFTSTANEVVRKCEQSQAPLSLILFDLDDFKAINDTFGHQIGDNAIKKAVLATKKGCRINDFMGRLGGEEFGILLEGCSLEKAYEIAQACRAQIEKTNESSTQMYRLSASFGVVSSQTHGYDYDVLFDVCDKAMYQSKRDGKNKVSRSQNTHHDENQNKLSFT